MNSVSLVHDHILSDCPLNPDTILSSTDSLPVREVKFEINKKLETDIEKAIEFHTDQTEEVEVSLSKVNRHF